MISDTVLIQNGTARVLTECTRKLSDISYFFKSTSKKTKSKKTDHADESIEEIDDSDDDAKQGRTKMDTPVGRKIRTRSRTGHAKVDEEAMRRREAHQSGLLKKLVRDSLLKYTQEEEEGKDPSSAASFLKTGGSTAYKEIECYKKEAFLPKAVRDLKVPLFCFAFYRSSLMPRMIVSCCRSLACPFHSMFPPSKMLAKARKASLSICASTSIPLRAIY